jgi:glutamate dehydrogenase
MIEKEPAFDKFLFKYFPKSFVSVYEDEIREHHLKKEIMSMMIANEIINFFGSSFICDYEELEEERFLLKIKAYLIGNDLFRANDIRYELYRNDHQIESSKMYELLLTIEEAILYNANWMIKGLYEKEICYTYILEHQHSIDSLLSHLKMQKKEIVKGNERINEFFSKINYMKLVTGIIIVYKNEAQDFIQTGRLFYTLIEKLHIVTIMEAIEKVAVKDKTQAVLQDQLRKIIEILMIDLTESVLGFKRKNENEQKAVEGYLKERAFNTEEFENMINSLNNSHKVSIDDLGIVINTLLLI